MTEPTDATRSPETARQEVVDAVPDDNDDGSVYQYDPNQGVFWAPPSERYPPQRWSQPWFDWRTEVREGRY